MGRRNLERWVESFVFETRLGGELVDSTPDLTLPQRLQMGVEEVGTVLRKIWPYLLVGIGVGALIHGWVPEDFFTMYAGEGATFGVLVAVLIGIPLYSNVAGVLQLVGALYDKGLPMGTLLAFMMAVVALSLPEMVLLRRVLKPQLIGVYLAVVCTSIVAVGYLFTRCWAELRRKGRVMIIKVLGPGCKRCVSVERVTRQAIEELGLDATVEKVPALVVDDRVVVSGREPTAAEVRDLLAATRDPA